MTFEKVHTVRDYYDGIRSGTADLNGLPHYFECPLLVETEDYADYFRLSPVDEAFMAREVRRASLHRDWEIRFHRGTATMETAPYAPGVSEEYTELDARVEGVIWTLTPLKTLYRATFRNAVSGDNLPLGVLREQEVCWTIHAG